MMNNSIGGGCCVRCCWLIMRIPAVEREVLLLIVSKQ
jgi:hypothetical protein